MTDAELDELEKLAEEATAGPWQRVTPYGIGVKSDGPIPFVVAWSKKENDAAFIAAANPATILALIHELRTCRAKLAGYERLQKRVERLRTGAKSLKSTVDFLVSNLTDRIGEEKFDEMRRDALIKKLFDAGVCPENCDCGQVGKEERNYDSDESGCYSCWLLWSYDMARRECEKGEEDESA